MGALIDPSGRLRSAGGSPDVRAERTNDLTGAVADLGVMVPLAAALILVNGLDAAAVFIAAGLLVLASGAYFRVPFPVQPLKALTAVAVAQQLAPGVIHAAGLEIAAFLLLLSMRGVANVISRAFTKPVVRALQLGVGALLVLTAWRMAIRPPDVFDAAPRSPWTLSLAIVAFCAVWIAARSRRYSLAFAMLLMGIAITWMGAAADLHAPAFRLPSLALPAAADWAPALLLLVVPQLPLTFGNAVVAVTDVAHDAFGARARHVTPARVCVSCGAGNVVSAVIGGLPMCHGAGGLTAHVRLGANTMWMNVGLGCAFIVLGVFFAPQIPELLGLLPVWVLAAFLAYAGLRHASLITDLRGTHLFVAVVAGSLGAALGNLAVTLGVAVVCELANKSIRAGQTRRRADAATVGAAIDTERRHVTPLDDT